MKAIKQHYQNLIIGFGKGGKTLAAYLAKHGQDVPPIPGVQSSKKVYTSTSLMEQSVLPRKLVVIGAGFIGLEFADMYSKFGAEVTILNNEAVFLPHEDKDIADEILKVLSAKGIRIVNDVRIEGIKDLDNDLVQVDYHHEGKLVALEVNAILMATGRKPNIDGLNVAVAGIELNKRGYIVVDKSLKTSQPHIWAIGDVNGGPQFTYISLDDFRIIRDQIFAGDYTSVSDRKQVAFSVFISPSLAHIGLREKEAIEQGYKIKVAKLPAAAIPRARILNETNGVLKTIVDVETNKILGCTLFCVDSSEMINTVQIAINAGLDFKVLRDAIYTHPSMTEALNDLYGLI